MNNSNNTFYIVDAFTDKPFSGNPAAVCILKEDISDELKQSIASEINLSETAFLFESDNQYNLRWFTPTSEVDLCGHATLASAHILWEIGELQENSEAIFETKSGILKARFKYGLIEMDFPTQDVSEIECPKELYNAIPHKPLMVGKNKYDYLAEYESEEIIRNLKPDLISVAKLNSRGLIITAKSSFNDYDFVSRFFAPNAGISEDPVTGSAHCALAPYWSEKLSKESLVGLQVSKRSGVVFTTLHPNKVVLSGKAITVMKSILII